MKSNLLIFFCLLILCTPAVVFGAEDGAPVIIATQAATFTPLVGIPGIPNPTGLEFGEYINALYRLAISLAALLAVFKIVIAGAKYMLDDIVTHKQEAKEEIKGALVGLIVILGAWIILNTINTDITKNMITITPVVVNNDSPEVQELINETIKAMQDANNLCASAKTEEGEVCITEICESGDCSAWCETVDGQYIKGSILGLGTDYNYFNSCTYIDRPNPGNIVDVTDQAECDAKGEDFQWVTEYPPYCFYLGNTELSTEEESTLRENLCVDGYNCEVALCELEPSWFRDLRCNEWCSTESGFTGEFSAEFDACYSNTTPN